jgi:DNA-binding transcriptional regulator GbsR (MarR family)
MSRGIPTRLQATRQTFIQAGGHTTQSFGFGRIIGQIFALLYLNPKPMCLDEIAVELGVSKASVSISIRQLQVWSAVKPVWVKGDRRDYYEAETDFNNVVRNGLLTKLRRKLETAGEQITLAEDTLQDALQKSNGNGSEKAELETVANRIRQAKQFHSRISGLLGNPLVERIL